MSESNITSENKEMEQLNNSSKVVNTNNVKDTTDKVNPEELYNEALKLVKNKEYDNAISLLSTAVETLINENRDNLRFELAKYYLLFGKALLRNNQSKNDVLGSELATRQLPQKDETNDNTEETEQDKKEENKVEDKKNDENNEKTENNKVSNGKEEIEENDEKQESKEDENSDNVSDEELCWEYLELCRVTIEKNLEETKNITNNNNKTNNDSANIPEIEKYKMLEAVHCLLGEYLLEQGQYESSYKEFIVCLDLHKNKLKSDIRDIAATHFWASLAAEYNNDFNNIDKHRSESEVLLADRLKELINNNNKNNKYSLNESSDFETIIETVKQFLNENKNNKELKDLCDEINELKDTLSDLVSRSDETNINENNENSIDMNKLINILHEPDGFKKFLQSSIGGDIKPLGDEKENSSKQSNTFDSNENDNEIVHEISSMNIRRKPKKRSMDEAGITGGPQSKRVKLNPVPKNEKN